ncbi:MAG: phosphate ABC transporter permease subunit PstC [Phycisphaerales bacterium]
MTRPTPTPPTPSATAETSRRRLGAIGSPRSRTVQRVRERGILGLLFSAGFFTVGVTAALVVLLFERASGFFGTHSAGTPDETTVTFTQFVTGTEWNPLLGAEKHFGIWPLIWGTTLVAMIAMAVAIPLGLITAVFLSEYAPRKLRAVLKPVLEILAGVPTVVYGFFALTVITPSLRGFSEWFTGILPGVDPDPIFGGYNATSAGIAVGIMCLPIVTSLSEDALRAVPRSLREAAYAVGSTRFEVSVRVVMPAALSGIVAAVLLAIARAVGETMIVALAAGGTAKFLASPTESAQTMTAYMVQIFKGDVSNFGAEYYSAYAVACTLFVMTLVLTLIGSRVLKRFREVYD